MRLLSPPPMTAPFTDVSTEFELDPPTMVGAAPATGCTWIALALLTRKSRGWLSVVPMKFAPGIVPELPVVFQALPKAAGGTVPPARLLAFKFARAAPLPAKLLPALLSVTAAPYVPDKPALGRPP